MDVLHQWSNARYICDGTKNCPIMSITTCWRSSQVLRLCDALKKKKKKMKQIDHMRFQRNIDFIPASMRYILINNLFVLKSFLNAHTQSGGHFIHVNNNSIFSSLFRFCEIFQSKITIESIYSFDYVNKSYILNLPLLWLYLKFHNYYYSSLYFYMWHNTE